MEVKLRDTWQLLDPKDLERRSLTANVRAFRDSIVQTGRCRSLTWRLQPRSSEWYKFLLLPRYEESNDHKYCEQGVCILHNIDEKTYKPQHFGTCNDCEFLESDQNIVEKCISTGQIPLIHCYEDSDGVVQLETVSGNLQCNYTAISHVWSGGLGNFKRTNFLDIS